MISTIVWYRSSAMLRCCPSYYETVGESGGVPLGKENLSGETRALLKEDHLKQMKNSWTESREA